MAEFTELLAFAAGIGIGILAMWCVYQADRDDDDDDMAKPTKPLLT